MKQSRSTKQGTSKKQKQPKPKGDGHQLATNGANYSTGRVDPTTTGAVSKEPLRIVPMEFSEQSTSPLIGSTGTLSSTFSLNPGDSGNFPRLFKIARLYTYYRFKSLRVRYHPLGSAFAANNQTGEIVVGITDDWYSAPPDSIAVARSRKPCCAGEAWRELALVLPPALGNKWRFVRDGGGCQGNDARLYELSAQITSNGTPNSSQIGYLEMFGVVEFLEPYTPSIAVGPVTNRFLQAACNPSQSLTSGVPTFLQANSVSMSPASSLTGVTLSTSSTLTVGFSTGSYVLNMTVTFTSSALTGASLTWFPNGAPSGGTVTSTIPAVNSTFAAAATVTSYSITAICAVTIPESGTQSTVLPLCTVTGTGTTVAVQAYNITILSV